MKRVFDTVFSILAVVLVSPLLLILSMAIFAEDGGPVLFIQERIGQGGRRFKLLKLRTMKVQKHAAAGLFEPGNTNRVTRIGRFLRKFKLDELPQFMNVIWGDMAIVGPRPEVEKWVREFPDVWNRVLTVRPGITDNAALEFRNEESLLAASSDPERTYRDIILPRKLDLYIEYIDNQSLIGDIVLVFKTLSQVFLTNTRTP
jgi:lipopolysaccharide/colanic/teichoic acid biosynthesis glycosyltransferase